MATKISHPHLARKKRASGGRTKPAFEYNAKDTPAMDTAMATADEGFKRGGKKLKKGGMVGGAKPKKNLGKRARGGQVMSSGHALKDPDTAGPGMGLPGAKVPEVG